MKCLVTGNLGYIGFILANTLLKNGHEVIGYDCAYFPPDCFGRKDAFEASRTVTQITKDIRNVLKEDMKDVDAVLHLAALPNDPSCDISPEAAYEVNHLGTVKLAKTAKEAGVKKFIFASSCSIFGAKGNKLITEDEKPSPITPYGISKLFAERDLLKLNSKDFATVSIRNATCYGVSPRMRFDMVLNSMVGYAYTERRVKILSDGTAWRPIIHIEDLSTAYSLIIRADQSKIGGQTFSLGTENFEIGELAKIVSNAVPKSHVYYEKGGKKDPRSYNVSFEKFNKAFVFKPKWNAELGADELLKAYKSYGLNEQNFQDKIFWAGKYFKYLLDSNKVDRSMRLLKNRA